MGAPNYPFQGNGNISLLSGKNEGGGICYVVFGSAFKNTYAAQTLPPNCFISMKV